MAIPLFELSASIENRGSNWALCDKKIPIKIRDCQVQLNKFPNKLEVVLKSKTQVEEANIEVNVPDLKTVGSSII